MVQQTTRYIRVEIDITLNTAATPAQLATQAAAIKTRLNGMAGVTVGNCNITAYRNDADSDWSTTK